ncbi:hypothetical protein [Kitasatospora sp. NPDC057223]
MSIATINRPTDRPAKVTRNVGGARFAAAAHILYVLGCDCDPECRATR